MKLWIVTEDYNDYDQHGSYFIAAYASKPTVEMLTKLLDNRIDGEHVFNGGGRRKWEDSWYNLHEIDEGKTL